MNVSHFRRIRVLVFLATPLVLVAAVATGQPSSAGSSTWTVGRTADGHPDLQGIWANNSITPLERPEALAGRDTMTAEELARVEAKAAQLFSQDAGDAAFGDQFFSVAVSDAEEFTSTDGGTGNYNQFWLVEREFNDRTSLITDPPDGRLPPVTSAAKMSAASAVAGRGRPAAWTDDRGLSERCITFGLPNLLAGYNSYYQIFQTEHHIAIYQELIHDTRIIPLDPAAHVHDDIRLWFGDSRGHWEGDTLVVETTNFSSQSNFRGAREHLYLVERFTRVGPDDMHYEFTVRDPTTWTDSWTAQVPWSRTDDAVFEYACHEGNIGMEGILSGARAEEAAH